MDKETPTDSAEISPKRLRMFKIIAIGFGLFLALFLSELATRIYYFGPDTFSYAKVNSFIPIGTSGFLTPADNNKVLYELKPNIDEYFKLKKFKTNSLGHRDKEYSLTKPDNTIRGLVLGDSFTMGSGVDIEDVYHSVVEDALNAQSDDINYELINFGVGGYNLLNYLGILEAKAAEYNPDFIIIGYCAFNDYFLPSKMHYEGNYQVKVKQGGRKPFFSFYLGGLIEKTFFPGTPSQMFEMQPEQVTFINEMFAAFSAFSTENDIPIVVNALSVLPDNGNTVVVEEIAAKHNIPMIDSFGKIDQEQLSSYIISKLDHHPNAKANKIYANTLLEFDKFQEMIEKLKGQLAAGSQ